MIDPVAGGGVDSNPFIILTFIVAPAILTNASALMVMSTTNRFARAIDRARELYRQIEGVKGEGNSRLLDRLDAELLKTENRAALLLIAIRSFYASLGGFAFAALVALIGAGMASMGLGTVIHKIFAVVAVMAVVFAVCCLVFGSIVLVRETVVTVGLLKQRIQHLKEHRKA